MARILLNKNWINWLWCWWWSLCNFQYILCMPFIKSTWIQKEWWLLQTDLSLPTFPNHQRSPLQHFTITNSQIKHLTIVTFGNILFVWNCTILPFYFLLILNIESHEFTRGECVTGIYRILFFSFISKSYSDRCRFNSSWVNKRKCSISIYDFAVFFLFSSLHLANIGKFLVQRKER